MQVAEITQSKGRTAQVPNLAVSQSCQTTHLHSGAQCSSAQHSCSMKHRLAKFHCHVAMPARALPLGLQGSGLLLGCRTPSKLGSAVLTLAPCSLMRSGAVPGAFRFATWRASGIEDRCRQGSGWPGAAESESSPNVWSRGHGGPSARRESPLAGT